ncbi:MAG: hypothetical protein WBP85_14735 [Terracidiphilus sp.]
MTIPGPLITLCFLLMMVFGAFLVLYSVLRLAHYRPLEPSEVSLPWLKLELKGPAWLVLMLLGAVMMATPIIAAALQEPASVTLPPASVQHVQQINHTDNPAFEVVRDVSLLDLRESQTASWYSRLLTWLHIRSNKQRIQPSVLKKYLIVRKLAPADNFQMAFATSGLLDVHCVTHSATYQNSKTIEGSQVTDGWNVIADVSTVPVGTEFEIAVEATYWNAFNGDGGDDFTTHARKQDAPEDISIFLLFPQDKPMKNIAVTEYSPDGGTESPFQGSMREWRGPAGQSYYWTTTNLRPGYYYKFTWKW